MSADLAFILAKIPDLSISELLTLQEAITKEPRKRFAAAENKAWQETSPQTEKE